jgi:plasmid maintenance system antidote protein VapI
MDAPQSLGSLTPEAVYRLQTGHSPIKFPDFSGKRGRPCSAGATRREQRGSEIDQVRYRNLTDIIIPVGLKKNLAQLMACSQGHVSHLLSGNRRVTRDTARGLEEVLGLPPLWMDTLQTPGSLTPEAVLRLKTGESPIRFPTSRAVRTETRLTAAGVRRLVRDLRMLRFDLNTTVVRLDAAREVLESVRIRTKSVARMQVEGDISPTEIFGRAAIALRKLDEARMLVEGIGIAIAEVAVTGNS